MKLFCFIGAALWLAGFGVLSHAQQSEQKAQDPLMQAQQKISNLESLKSKTQKALKQTERSYSEVDKALRFTNKKLSKKLTIIKGLKGKVRQAQKRLTALKLKQVEYRKQIAKQQAQIAKLLRMLHQMGHQSDLKRLLSMEDPQKIARLWQYYRYFDQSHQAEIERFQQMIEDNQSLQKEIDLGIAQLERSQQVLDQERLALKQTRSKQAGLLKQKQQQLSSQQKKLKELEVNRGNLVKLIEQLELEKFAKPPEVAQTPFAKSRGKLLWPVKGKAKYRYGQKKIGDEIKWQGHFIAAPLGEKVRAVHGGQVVFADWLRGSGLLMIIDHSDGYLTLYGQNQVLFYEAGDTVRSGDVIGEVAAEGVRNEPGAYFEIRHQARTLNPSKWCH